MSGILGGIVGNIAGGNIGRATVALALDTTGYNSQLEKAKVETVGATNTMGGGFSKFKGVALAGAAVATAAVVDFATEAVQAAIEAENSQLKLANAVQNSGSVAEEAIPAFQAQAQALRDLTGVDDDVINASQSILVNMGLQQDQITELTPLVVDLSQKYGVSLDTAMKAVGKAALGSTGGLARMVGPIEAGATAGETYTNVLDKLGSVAGFAGQQAKAEPWRLLSSQWDEMKEQVGRELLPAIQEIVPVITQLAKDLVPLFTAAVRSLVPALELLAGTATGVHDALGLLQGDMPEDFWQKGINNVNLATRFMGGMVPPTQDVNDALVEQATRLTELYPTLSATQQAQVDAALASGGLEAGLAAATGGAEDLGAAAGDMVPEVNKAAEAVKEWGGTVRDSFLTLESSTKDIFDITQKEMNKAFNQMLADALRFKGDMAALLSLKPGTLGLSKSDLNQFIGFMRDQGPGYIDAFVNASAQKQEAWVEKWRRSVAAVNGLIQNGIPDEKTVNINLNLTDRAIIEKLSRIGV